MQQAIRLHPIQYYWYWYRILISVMYSYYACVCVWADRWTTCCRGWVWWVLWWVWTSLWSTPRSPILRLHSAAPSQTDASTTQVHPHHCNCRVSLQAGISSRKSGQGSQHPSLVVWVMDPEEIFVISKIQRLKWSVLSLPLYIICCQSFFSLSTLGGNK